MRVDKFGDTKSNDNSAVTNTILAVIPGSDSGEFSLSDGVKIISLRADLTNPCQCL